MKFAKAVLVIVMTSLSSFEEGFTICGGVHDDEACVDLGGVFALCPVHGIRMPPKAVRGLVEIDIVVSAVEGP